MKTKVALIVLLVALGILGWYCYQQGPAVQQELDVAREDLRVASNQVVVTSSQLTLMSNQLATAKAEIVKVKTQLAVVKESVQEKPVTTAKTGKPKGDRTGPPSSHTKTADARGTDERVDQSPAAIDRFRVQQNHHGAGIEGVARPVHGVGTGEGIFAPPTKRSGRAQSSDPSCGTTASPDPD